MRDRAQAESRQYLFCFYLLLVMNGVLLLHDYHKILTNVFDVHSLKLLQVSRGSKLANSTYFQEALDDNVLI